MEDSEKEEHKLTKVSEKKRMKERMMMQRKMRT
jgi:hypothetical protein